MALIQGVTARLLILVAALVTCAAVVGCDEQGPPGRERVEIGGETFWLEPALDDQSRFVGLGGRESIEPRGGMVFVFPTSEPRSFVMRDCLTDIDIAFLDGAGRVVAVHEMKKEPPRRPDESMGGYEDRLTRYPSRYSCQIVVEVAPGTLRHLNVKPGDLIRLDAQGLKQRAR